MALRPRLTPYDAVETADGTGHRSPAVEPLEPFDPATCVPSADPGKSVARLWDEALLDAIAVIPGPYGERTQPLSRVRRHVGCLGGL